jgi:release factor glutamine methyltransferase
MSSSSSLPPPPLRGRRDDAAAAEEHDRDGEEEEEEEDPGEASSWWSAHNEAALERARAIRAGDRAAAAAAAAAGGDHPPGAAPPPPSETPSLGHLSYRDYERVYGPSDDTHLLADALRHEAGSGAWDRLASPPPSSEGEASAEEAAGAAASSSPSSAFIALEIGCGSGVPSVVARREWSRRFGGRRPLVSLATDLNPFAARVALRTARENASWQGDGDNDNVGPRPLLEVVNCDLAGCLLGRLTGRVDLLLFNPPYVPTPDDEVAAPSRGSSGVEGGGDGGAGIEASWAGGRRGRRVADRAAPQVARLLSPGGVAYVVAVDDNRPRELAARLRREHGLEAVPLLRRRAFNEHLTVLKITRRLPD